MKWMKLTGILCLFAIAACDAVAQGQSQPKLDVAFSVSTLGLGAQVARPLTSRSDVRGGFNFYNISRDSAKDGFNYSIQLKLNSINAQYDQYLFGPLFVSGGALLWNGNKIEGTSLVPGGQSFTLGSATYISESTSPVHGTTSISLRKAAPMALVGLGNLPKKGRIAFTVEGGVVFQGSPRSSISLAGHACPSGATGTQFPICPDIATTPSIQADIAAEQIKINNDLKPFKYYPVLQFTIGYKFK